MICSTAGPARLNGCRAGTSLQSADLPGSIEALKVDRCELPSDLPAAVFIVVHTSPAGRSYYSRTSSRGELRDNFRRTATASKTERSIIAPPDQHLLDRQGSHPPQPGTEGRTSPAEHQCDLPFSGNGLWQRVAGVLLSGMLDDGASGLWEISQRGGVAIVQDPAGAPFPSMPLMRSQMSMCNISSL